MMKKVGIILSILIVVLSLNTDNVYAASKASTLRELRSELSALKAEKIPIWACAAVIGVHENTLLRKLRFELSDQEKKPIFEAIESIKNNQEG